MFRPRNIYVKTLIVILKIEIKMSKDSVNLPDDTGLWALYSWNSFPWEESGQFSPPPPPMREKNEIKGR